VNKRSEEIETVPHNLNACSSGPRVPTDARTFANTVANFFRRNGGADTPESVVANVLPSGLAPEVVQRAQAVSKSTFYKHWDAIKAEGITASQFIAFLQPLADLDGITVSYTHSDEDGKEHVYNHRHEDSSV
jgi:hypothetical protein